jgi:hypothetical protein
MGRMSPVGAPPRCVSRETWIDPHRTQQWLGKVGYLNGRGMAAG